MFDSYLYHTKQLKNTLSFAVTNFLLMLASKIEASLVGERDSLQIKYYLTAMILKNFSLVLILPLKC